MGPEIARVPNTGPRAAGGARQGAHWEEQDPGMPFPSTPSSGIFGVSVWTNCILCGFTGEWGRMEGDLGSLPG